MWVTRMPRSSQSSTRSFDYPKDRLVHRDPDADLAHLIVAYCPVDARRATHRDPVRCRPFDDVACDERTGGEDVDARAFEPTIGDIESSERARDAAK